MSSPFLAFLGHFFTHAKQRIHLFELISRVSESIAFVGQTLAQTPQLLQSPIITGFLTTGLTVLSGNFVRASEKSEGGSATSDVSSA
ncbi:MAG TPA: hypothetical protein PLR80_00315 [Saccharofermentans sp.]|nr:hypothetical protein [Saccharofermentans sp.]